MLAVQIVLSVNRDTEGKEICNPEPENRGTGLGISDLAGCVNDAIGTDGLTVSGITIGD